MQKEVNGGVRDTCELARGLHKALGGVLTKISMLVKDDADFCDFESDDLHDVKRGLVVQPSLTEDELSNMKRKLI